MWPIINVVSMFSDILIWPVVVLILGWRLMGTGRLIAKSLMASVLAITQKVAKK